jgi:hypothetical protein
MICLTVIHRRLVLAAGASLALAGQAAAWDGSAAPVAPFEPPPVIFEGLGLGDFEGTGSVASALSQAGGSAQDRESLLEFKGIEVRGPSGPHAAPAPMAAEVQSRIDWIDVAAGVTADPERLREGPSRWTGRIGVSHDRESGSESLEVRTMVLPSETASMIGVTVGPKIERKLGRGLTVFIDGQAEAQAYRPADAGWLSLPGVADGSLATLGLTARTGIVR